MQDIDLDTLIVMIYVFVDEWYETHIARHKKKQGRPPLCSDSEIVTLAVLSEYRQGVSWGSERDFLRTMHKHYGEWFPNLPQRSGFNQRKRRLLGVIVQLQAYLGDYLEQQGGSDQTELYECVDCLPIPAGSLGQYTRGQGHWLWESRVGKGQGGWFWGDRLLAAVRPNGVISGWLIGSADINDRWLLEGLLSARHGAAQLIGPDHRVRSGVKAHITPPVGFIGSWATVGKASPRHYLADKGFSGYRWRRHWKTRFQATVWSVPPDNSRQETPWTRQSKQWIASKRQIVETVFSVLTNVFHIKHLRAHSRWGQYTRIAAKIAAYHFGILFNRSLGRATFSHATLVC